MRLPWRAAVLRRWHQIPLPLRLIAHASAWFGYGVLLSMLNGADDNPRSLAMIWAASGVGAVVTSTVDAMLPRVFGSIDELVSYSAALQAGQPPAGVDPAVWLSRIRRSRVAGVAMWWFLIVFIGFALLSADSSPMSRHLQVSWALVVLGVGAIVELHRRAHRIKRLGAAVRAVRAQPTPISGVSGTGVRDKVQEGWRTNSELSRPARFILTVTMASALAFLVLVIADLDAVVYSDSRTSHAGNAALWAIATGLIASLLLFSDPRITSTDKMIDAIVQYDLAFRGGGLPRDVEVDRWRRWIRTHRRSNFVVLLWGGFFFAVAAWSLSSDPTGYNWIVAGLLGVLGIGQVRRWRSLRAMLHRLETEVESHAVRQLFG